MLTGIKRIGSVSTAARTSRGIPARRAAPGRHQCLHVAGHRDGRREVFNLLLKGAQPRLELLLCGLLVCAEGRAGAGDHRLGQRRPRRVLLVHKRRSTAQPVP